MFWAVSCLQFYLEWSDPARTLHCSSGMSSFACLFHPFQTHSFESRSLSLLLLLSPFPTWNLFCVLLSIFTMVLEHSVSTIASRTLTSSLGASCFSSLTPAEANLLTENHTVLSGYHFVNLICLAHVTLMLNVTLLSLRLPSSPSVTVCISFTEAVSSCILPRLLHFTKMFSALLRKLLSEECSSPCLLVLPCFQGWLVFLWRSEKSQCQQHPQTGWRLYWILVRHLGNDWIITMLQLDNSLMWMRSSPFLRARLSCYNSPDKPNCCPNAVPGYFSDCALLPGFLLLLFLSIAFYFWWEGAHSVSKNTSLKGAWKTDKRREPENQSFSKRIQREAGGPRKEMG